MPYGQFNAFLYWQLIFKPYGLMRIFVNSPGS
jgi:hypothetical protein